MDQNLVTEQKREKFLLCFDARANFKWEWDYLCIIKNVLCNRIRD